jgi:hypothetical protein
MIRNGDRELRHIVAKHLISCLFVLVIFLSGCSSASELPASEKGTSSAVETASIVPFPTNPPSSTPPPVIIRTTTATLVLAESPTPTPTRVPTQVPTATEILQPVRIEFEPGATLWQRLIENRQDAPDWFVLRVTEGQTMQISALPFKVFKITGEDGESLNFNGTFFWRGQVPRTQDYFITMNLDNFRSCGPSLCPNFALTVAIAPPGMASQTFQYTDEENGFSLTYSDYFAIDPDPAYPSEPELSLLLVEPDFYWPTNLNEAYFLISVHSDPEIMADCGDFPAPGSTGSGEVVIGGVSYNWANYIEGGAGNVWDSTIFSTVRGDSCFSVTYFLHSHRAENYDPPATPFDRETIIEMMMEIFKSLEFTDL